MVKKIKTQIQKSVDFYGETFPDAVWQSEKITVNRDTVGVLFNLYHDAAEADAEGIPINDIYNHGHTITADPPAGRVDAVLALVAGDTADERIATLANALLAAMADVEIAEGDSKLFGGVRI